MGKRLGLAISVATLASLVPFSPRPAAAEEPFTEEVARRLLPEAAELDNAPAWNVIVMLGAAVTLTDLRAGEAFALPYVAMIVGRLQTPEAERDFRPDPTLTPIDLGAAMNGGKPLGEVKSTKGISLLRAEYVKKVTVKQDGTKATGEVDFEAPGFYRGHLVFEALFAAGAWRISAFEFPATKARIKFARGGWREVTMPAPMPPVRLPEVSSVDVAPASGSSIVIGVSDRHVWVGQEEVRSFAALRQQIAGRTHGLGREADGTSKADVVIYGDEDAPWSAMQWVMQILASPPAQAFRIHFAARHRKSGETGAIAAFLPRDRGLRASPDVVREMPTMKISLFSRDQGTATTPEAVFAELTRLRTSLPPDASLELATPLPSGSRIRFGLVLKIMDAARQAGFTKINFVGTPMPMPKRHGQQSDHDLAEALAAAAAQPRGVPIAKIGGRDVAPAANVTIPDGPAPSAQKTSSNVPSVAPAEEPDNELPEETEQVHQDDVVAREPTIKDAELSDHNETDKDLPMEETFGEGGVSDAPFEGPPQNDLLGVGGGRGGAFRSRAAHRRGVGARPAAADAAVEAALRWLAAHQSPDGGWEAAGAFKWCDGKPVAQPRSEDAGKALYDVGVTGLALLAYLGAGYTNRSEGPYGKVIASGLRYLRNSQDPEGCFGPRTSAHYIYNHAMAALAMVEAYALTGSVIYKNPSQKALDFIAIARNPYFAWRYGVKPGDNDTSVTGWMVAALHSARLVNEADKQAGKQPTLMLDDDAFDGVRAWIDKMTDPDYGRVGYQQRGTGSARPTELVDRFPSEKTEAMTAVGVLARAICGEDPRSSAIIGKGADLITKLRPTWNTEDGSIDMDYWYFGSLAMFQLGGARWKAWEDALKAAVIPAQRTDSDACGFKGSWDPIDPWGPDGGRVYATAMVAMCLEAPYRYPRLFEDVKPGK